MRSTTGLDNLGATCYLNATIQAIAHCPKLARAIVNCERRLLIRMWGGGPSIAPHELLRSLAAPMAKQGILEMREMHDANELFMVLSDILCQSTLKEVLEGRTRGSTVCGRCGATSLTPLEPFVSLNLDFEEASGQQLEEMIARSFASEEIEGYQCDTCEKRTSSKRTLQLWKLPQVLTFVLKRFLLNGDEVAIPGKITIRGNKEVTYELCSVVCHAGRCQQGGHYVTAARVPESGDWCIHDDESTIEVKGGSHVSRCAYMIIYEC